MIVTLDFETFYSDELSLSKMTTSGYVRHPEFEVLLCGVKIDDQPTQVYAGHDHIAKALARIDWSTSTLVCHNAMFDAFVLTQVFKHTPAVYADTLSLVRAQYPYWAYHNLDAAGEKLGLGRKVAGVLPKMKGRRLSDLSPEELLSYIGYCSGDTDLCYQLYQKLSDGFPDDELRLIDITIRMFAEPVLLVDADRASKLLVAEALAKDAAVTSSGVTREELTSRDKFAAQLKALGVDPPIKTSKTTGKPTWAFSKTDPGFRRLQAHPDPRVQALVKARPTLSSSLQESRARRFVSEAGAGALPVGLRYYAAHCLPGEAEVLTPGGWVRLSTWDGSTSIAQWRSDGSVAFLPATPNCYEVDESMVEVKSRYHSLRYTMGHKVPVISSRGVFKEVPAATLLATRVGSVPICGELDGNAPITEIEARLSVMVQADGSVRTDASRGLAVRFGFRKMRKIIRCKQLLEQAGIQFTEAQEANGTMRIRIGAKHVGQLTALLEGGSEKLFSWKLLNAPLSVKKAFIDELVHWDGDKNHCSAGITFYTTSRHNAEFVHTMAHLAGRSARVSCRDLSAFNWNALYRVYIRHDRTTGLAPAQCSIVEHRGKVYCPTTQTGYFLVRYKGSIVVTGNTGRWGGANKLNLQNLPRGGELRKSIMAPPGYVLVVADLSQIECRMLAWLAEEKDLLQIFIDGRDPYGEFASEFYGYEVTKENPKTATERFVGKSCLQAGAKVLCERGWIPIEQVTTTDRVWDGEEWVCHAGSVMNGWKETLPLSGLWLTPDHLVWSGTQWLEARLVEQDDVILSQALAHAADTLPSRVTSEESPVPWRRSSFSARAADLSTLWRMAASRISAALAVIRARSKHQDVSDTGSTLTPCLTTNTEAVFSTDLQQLLPGATTRKISATPVMGGAASVCMKSGAKTARYSSGMFRRSLGGMTRLWRWIEPTTTATTNQGTSGSLRANKTTPTGGGSKILRQRLPVYDLLSCGPRNRFAVLTERGPLIVHNCVLGLGFQMSAKKLQFTLEIAKPSVSLDMETCVGLVDLYRGRFWNIPRLWRRADTVICSMAYGAPVALGPVETCRWATWLPNGMALQYWDLTANVENDRLQNARYKNERGQNFELYGGKWVENVVQALARIVMSEAMLRIDDELPIVMTTHDEVVVLAKEEEAEDVSKFVHEEMVKVPAWCPGLPLACEVGYDVCYSK